MKYTITECEGFAGNRVFSVTWPLTDSLVDGVADIWWKDGRGNCTRCQLPLQAMSGSCAHVKAVRRYLNRRGEA